MRKVQWRAVRRIFGEAMVLQGNGENFENCSLKRHVFKPFGGDLKKSSTKTYSFFNIQIVGYKVYHHYKCVYNYSKKFNNINSLSVNYFVSQNEINLSPKPSKK